MISKVLGSCLLFTVVVIGCTDDEKIALNQSPGDFEIISPLDGAENVEANPELSWGAAEDLEGDEVVYSLYLDTNQASTLIAGDLMETSYQITDSLDFNTTYKWKVVAQDHNGAFNRTSVSTFVTKNNIPAPFELLIPHHNAQPVPTSFNFFWEAARDIDGDEVFYDVYLDTTPDPVTTIASDISDITLLVENLDRETVYYWKVVAKDATGDMTDSDIFSFTTDFTIKWLPVIDPSHFTVGFSNPTMIEFNNEMLIISDSPSSVHFLANGAAEWGEHPSPPFDLLLGDHQSLVFNDTLWVIEGVHGIYKTHDVSNASNWIEVNTADPAFSVQRFFSAVVYDNKMWVIGGFEYPELKREVWYSSDGENWTLATDQAPFMGRDSHTSLVFDNKMWVIGGRIREEGEIVDTNDVWYSSDGISWTQATSDAGFEKRSNHTSIVYDNKMWVIGGSRSSEILNDTWYSTDGITWTKVDDSIETYSVRENAAAVEFQDQLFLFGGLGYTANWKTDVWFYQGE